MPRPSGLPHDEIAGLYRAGVQIKDIAARYGCTDRAVRHIARKFRLAGRKGIHPPIRGPFVTTHPLLRDLFANAAARRISMRGLSSISGVGRTTLNKWARHSAAPDFHALVAAGEALGLELTWERKADV